MMFLGDTGATFGALSAIANLLLFKILQLSYMFDSYLINQVFRYKNPNTNKIKRLHLSIYSWLENYLFVLLGKSKIFKPRNYFSKIDHKARKIGMRRIDRELDIGRFIRN